VLLGNTRVLLGNTSVLLGNTRVLLGNTRVLIGNTSVLLGNTKVLLGNTRVLLGNTSVLLGRVFWITLLREVELFPTFASSTEPRFLLNKNNRNFLGLLLRTQLHHISKHLTPLSSTLLLLIQFLFLLQSLQSYIHSSQTFTSD